jgi:hypothetical protein
MGVAPGLGQSAVVARQGLFEGEMQGGGQGLTALQEPLVEGEHELGGEAVVHRVAHGQRGAVELAHQGLGQARQHRLLGGGALLGGKVRGGVLALGAKFHAEPGTSGGVTGRPAVAGVEDEELQTGARGSQQLGQIPGLDAVDAAGLGLDEQLALLAVPRELDQVPTRRLFEQVAQGLASGPVLDDAQLHRLAFVLAQVAHQSLELVALAAQVQGVGLVRQTEDRQHPQGLIGSCLGAAAVRGVGELIDEADAELGEGRLVGAREPGELERAQQQGLGLRRDLHPHSGRRRLVLREQGVLQAAEDLRADPGAEGAQLLGRRAHGLVEVEVVAQAQEAAVLAAARVQRDLLIGEELAVGVAELPAPMGFVTIVGDDELKRCGHLVSSLLGLGCPASKTGCRARIGIKHITGRCPCRECYAGNSGEVQRRARYVRMSMHLPVVVATAGCGRICHEPNILTLSPDPID